jgi:hypothetical protein
VKVIALRTEIISFYHKEKFSFGHKKNPERSQGQKVGFGIEGQDKAARRGLSKRRWDE